MRESRWFVSLFLAVLGVLLAIQSYAAETITIATWNIENLSGEGRGFA